MPHQLHQCPYQSSLSSRQCSEAYQRECDRQWLSVCSWNNSRRRSLLSSRQCSEANQRECDRQWLFVVKCCSCTWNNSRRRYTINYITFFLNLCLAFCGFCGHFLMFVQVSPFFQECIEADQRGCDRQWLSVVKCCSCTWNYSRRRSSLSSRQCSEADQRECDRQWLSVVKCCSCTWNNSRRRSSLSSRQCSEAYQRECDRQWLSVCSWNNSRRRSLLSSRQCSEANQQECDRQWLFVVKCCSCTWNNSRRRYTINYITFFLNLCLAFCGFCGHFLMFVQVSPFFQGM
ncbi:hypothetical protein RND81_05G126900 [Saponaria officinalis]|uniref:Uncharacterized protein n=1 Tax=Saponaria officinalis TaxID=3572 RepID=A0AAW1KV34_SAPOF